MMRKAYKDRMLPEAFKKRIEKVKAQRKPGDDKPVSQDLKKSAKSPKGEKREDPGSLRSYMDHPKLKRGMKREDPKGNPAGYYDSSKKKKKKVDKSPYADGMGKKCTCDSVAEELRGLLIKEDDEVERADKPCGGSYIPENRKCSKQTTLRVPTEKKSKRSTNYAAGAAKGLSALATYGVTAGTLSLAGGAITQQVNQVKRRKIFLEDLKAAKWESNRKYGQAKEAYKKALSFNKSLKNASIRARSNKWAEQNLKEEALKNKMARTEIKLAIRRAKNSFPKSTARARG